MIDPRSEASRLPPSRVTWLAPGPRVALQGLIHRVYFAGFSNATLLPGNANGANPTPLNAGFGTFVAKMSLNLDAAPSATWISGGLSGMTPYAMTLGDDGSVYAGGSGRGTLVDTTGAYQPDRPGGTNQDDGFVTHLSSDLGTHYRSTFLGGSAADPIENLWFGEGNLYVSGNTNSGSDFPSQPPLPCRPTRPRVHSYLHYRPI